MNLIDKLNTQNPTRDILFHDVPSEIDTLDKIADWIRDQKGNKIRITVGYKKA